MATQRPFKFLSLGEALAVRSRYQQGLGSADPLPPPQIHALPNQAFSFYHQLDPASRTAVPDDWPYGRGLDYLIGVLLIPREAIYLNRIEDWPLPVVAERYHGSERLVARRLLEVATLDRLERTSALLERPSSVNEPPSAVSRLTLFRQMTLK